MDKKRLSDKQGVHISGPMKTRRNWNQTDPLFRESEQRFRNIFEQVPIGINQVSPEGESLFANRALQYFLGYTDREMHGRLFTAWVHPDDTALSYEILQRLLSGACHHEAIEKRYIRKDAQIVWGRTSVSAVLGDGGGIESFLVMVEDITERKEMESSSVLHKTIFDSLGEAVFVVDSKTRTILSCNTATERVTGYTTPEMIGKKIDFLYENNQMYEVFGEMVDSALASKGICKLEWRHRRKGGRIVLIEHTIREIRNDANGRSIKIDVTRDVTEEKETLRRLERREMELKEKTDRLEEMNTALRVLLDEREVERNRMEENFSNRVNSLILPYLDRIRASDLSGLQAEQFDILAANLMETVRPYRQGVAEKMLHLSPREVLVVNHIRQGRSSKEIASQLNLSVRTVEFHRDNIRKKLGIKSRKINLQTFLARSII